MTGTAAQLYSLGSGGAAILDWSVLVTAGKSQGIHFILLIDERIGVEFLKIIHLMPILEMGHKYYIQEKKKHLTFFNLI